MATVTAWPSLEIVEVETIDCPPFAFFKIAVTPDQRLPERHMVTKSMDHLNDLTAVVAKEAPAYAGLSLPPSNSPQVLSSPGFVAQLELYLSVLSQAPEIVCNESFRECFQLSESYKSSKGCSGFSNVSTSQSLSSVPTTAASLASADRSVVDFGSKSQFEEESDDEEDLCVVCMEQPMCMAIVPCGHLSMCEGCCQGVHACPVCRGPVDKALRIFAD